MALFPGWNDSAFVMNPSRRPTSLRTSREDQRRVFAALPQYALRLPPPSARPPGVGKTGSLLSVNDALHVFTLRHDPKGKIPARWGDMATAIRRNNPGANKPEAYGIDRGGMIFRVMTFWLQARQDAESITEIFAVPPARPLHANSDTLLGARRYFNAPVRYRRPEMRPASGENL